MEPSEASRTDTPSSLPPLDRELAKLQGAFSGWRIWYVPRAQEHGGTVWCAQRLPLLNTDSAEHLAADMLDVDQRYSTEPYEADLPPVRRIHPASP